ncbi:MerR family transcriptional regulator [Isoptericola sp. NPDC019482]|uniref:MerR family transcriptional regulator n=1 Tax=Isoptericola sp. NPDC019482 TaxID=3154688 RepID=UPI003479A1C3
MRISGLAERTGVPVATLKFYLREGLLHAGTATARTQAVYDTTHVERVRLVRALTESAGLTLGVVREVLTVLDDPPTSRHELLGAAQHVMLAREGARPQEHAELSGGPSAPAADPWASRAAELVAARDWCAEDDPLVARLADQLRAADAAGIDLTDAHLAALAEAADTVAAADVASVPAERAGAVRQVVVGTLLTDPVLLTLRRMAQQRASAGVERTD